MTALNESRRPDLSNEHTLHPPRAKHFAFGKYRTLFRAPFSQCGMPYLSSEGMPASVAARDGDRPPARERRKAWDRTQAREAQAEQSQQGVLKVGQKRVGRVNPTASWGMIRHKSLELMVHLRLGSKYDCSKSCVCLFFPACIDIFRF